jgi:CheY-like chemotaxis protein
MTGKRVLVVDDDEGVRVTIEASLEGDYQVTTACSAALALSALGASANPFDVVICDLMMPEMTGPELFESLPEDSPLRKCFVFITGGNLPIAVESFVSLAAVPILKKPFTIAAIRAAVNEVAARS